MDTKKRSYEMRARKESTAATCDAIVQATIDVIFAQRSLAITLGAVADRAGVTVRTVLRHFGSRDALVDAASARALQDVRMERLAPPEDPDTALKVLIEHYEHWGDTVLGLLAEEDDDHRARLMCDSGRLEHRRWVQEVFETGLPAETADRARLVDALVVATDVYSWKLLRRDRGLTVDEVHDRMRLIADSVMSVAPQ